MAQPTPNNHQTAAIAVALGEALQPEFKEYGKQIVKNSKKLAAELTARGFNLVTGGTDNHLIRLSFAKDDDTLVEGARRLCSI